MDTLCKKMIWVALLLVIGGSVSAQINVSKKVERSYNMTDAGELNLENKYGSINLYGWDKDEVSVVIAIEVNHRKKENAENLLKRISTVIRESDNYVSIGYEIAEKNNGWFSRIFDEANPFDFNRSNVQIDYTVYMPAKAELKVTNTFGDVIIEDWSGQLKALVEHGDLWINQDLNKADITMRYGKLRARDIDYGNLDLKNGSLDMHDSKNLRITSSGNEMLLNKVNSLEFYSNKDEVTAKEIGTIYGSMKFSTLELNKLNKDVDLNLRVADFRVSQIIAPDAEIVLEQESSEISLNIDGFSHRFDATIEQGLVRLPKSFENIDSKILDKGKKLREIKGTYGNGLEGSISITGKKGVVLLKEL